jgi:hypothetical protein
VIEQEGETATVHGRVPDEVAQALDAYGQMEELQYVGMIDVQ